MPHEINMTRSKINNSSAAYNGVRNASSLSDPLYAKERVTSRRNSVISNVEVAYEWESTISSLTTDAVSQICIGVYVYQWIMNAIISIWAKLPSNIQQSD